MRLPASPPLVLVLTIALTTVIATGACSGDGGTNAAVGDGAPAAPSPSDDGGSTVDGDKDAREAATLGVGAPPQLFVGRGAAGAVAVTIVRTGWDGPVTITLAGAAGFTASAVTLPKGRSKASLDVLAATSAATTPVSATITATGNGLTASTTINLNAIASGAMDPGFGSGGVIVDSNVNPCSGGLLVQPDAKIVVADCYATNLVRYDDKGALDATFGKAGIATIPTPLLHDADDGSLARQPDGKLLLGHTLKVLSGADLGTSKLGLARLQADGSLDATFGTGGAVVTTFAGYNRSAVDGIAVQPDGAIVTVGRVWNVPGTGVLAAVVRYLPSGALDPAFGTGGMITHTWNGTAGSARADRVIASSTGLYVMGSRKQFGIDFATIAKLSSGGALDASFGVGGVYVYEAPGPCALPDCRLFSSFAEGASGLTFVVRGGSLGRVTFAGTLDTAFGTGGRLVPSHTTADAFSFTIAVAEESTGRLLIAEANNTKKSVEVGAHTSGGGLDATFGAQGRTSASVGAFTRPSAVAVAPDGRIVVMSPPYPDAGLVLARFYP